MNYRKLKGDKIFDGYTFVENGVLIMSGEGQVREIIAEANAGGDVEAFGGILSPGFINCHCHLELSHMKGLIPEKTGLVDFVFKVVTQRHHSEEQILDAIDKAEKEMLNNGIVAVGDICNNNLTIHQKKKGNLAYYNFIEASGWLPAISQLRFERAKILYEDFTKMSFEENKELSNIRASTLNSKLQTPNCSIVPHAPYSVSQGLWKEIQPYFEKKVTSIHNQETAFEDEFFLHGSGDFQRMYRLMNIDNSHHQPTNKSSLQSYFDKLSGAENAILVHNTFTKQEDFNYIKQPQTTNHKPQTFFCLCVNANKYIENALPPIELFRKNDSAIVLGTDSLASNWSLNILDEIKTIRSNFPSIALEEILKWATSNGARALQMNDRLGSFEKGKKPGVVLVNEKNLSARRLL